EGRTALFDRRLNLGNLLAGVAIEDAPGNLIGGVSERVANKLAGEGNLISGNIGYGVFITGLGAKTNTVQGNFIGTEVTCKSPFDSNGLFMGNAGDGVLIDGAPDNKIGLL